MGIIYLSYISKNHRFNTEWRQWNTRFNQACQWFRVVL